jgi:hypothetical protein
VARFGCFATVLSLFSEVDAALNPNGILRSSFKFKLQTLCENLEYANQTIKFIKKNQEAFKREMKEEIEKLCQELKDKSEDLAHYAQVLIDPKPPPRFEINRADLKVAPLTPHLARMLIHTDISSCDPIPTLASPPPDQ